MIDAQKLRKIVKSFVFKAKSGTPNNEPCSNKDLHHAIDEIAKMMKSFIEEIENK